MKIDLLGVSGGSTNSNNLTSFFIDDFLAIDAGSLSQTLSIEQQRKVSDILISHSHLDHTLSLPFLADNLFGEIEKPLQIWAASPVIKALKDHVFNEVTWPDFSILPSPEKPTIAFSVLEPEETFTIRHLKITPVPVNHVVPCFGYFIESTISNSCILYTGDTCNTDRIWQLANEKKNLNAVIVDCSFPNEYEALAVSSGHMTPKLLRRDLDKLKVDCDILVYHIKPPNEELLRQQLNAVGIARLLTDLQGKSVRY